MKEEARILEDDRRNAEFQEFRTIAEMQVGESDGDSGTPLNGVRFFRTSFVVHLIQDNPSWTPGKGRAKLSGPPVPRPLPSQTLCLFGAAKVCSFF